MQHTPKTEKTPAKTEYEHRKAEVEVLPRQREEAETRKEAHIRVVEQQRIIGQEARERLEKAKEAQTQIMNDLASAERDVRASEEASSTAETGIRDERQVAREKQREIDATRGRRETSRINHVQQDDGSVPKAAPPVYDPAKPTLRVTPAGVGQARTTPRLVSTRPGSRPSWSWNNCSPTYHQNTWRNFKRFKKASARRVAYQEGAGSNPNQGPGRWDQVHHYPFGDGHGEQQGWGNGGNGGGGYGGGGFHAGGGGNHHPEWNNNFRQHGGGGGGDGRDGGGRGGGGRHGGRRDNGGSKGRNRCETASGRSTDEDACSEVDTNQVLVDPAPTVTPKHKSKAKITATPATTREGGGGGHRATSTRSIKRSYARFDTNVLIAVPGIPFSSDHNVPELVHIRHAQCHRGGTSRLR